MKHRARQVSADDFTKYDYILCMDEENLRDLKDMAPKGYTATSKPKNFCSRSEHETLDHIMLHLRRRKSAFSDFLHHVWHATPSADTFA